MRDIYVNINTETYRNLKNDFDFPEFLPIHNYSSINDAKKNEVGRIKNIHFILENDIRNMKIFMLHLLDEAAQNTVINSPHAFKLIRTMMNYLDDRSF